MYVDHDKLLIGLLFLSLKKRMHFCVLWLTFNLGCTDKKMVVLLHSVYFPEAFNGNSMSTQGKAEYFIARIYCDLWRSVKANTFLETDTILT